jgi:predicted negative regulator of RcsB-dependent stress response
MKAKERQRLKQDEVAETLQDVYLRAAQYRTRITALVVGVLVVAIAAGGWVWYQSHQAARAGALLAEGLVISEAQVIAPAQPADGTPAPPQPPNTYPTEEAKLEAALPKFIAAADAYPSTNAGIAARYHAATTLVALGRGDEARQHYEAVIARDGRGLYGRMARLGMAELDVKAQRYDAAIAALQELSLDAKGDLPVDAVLVQLGEAYLAAGRTAEAQQAFQRVTTEFTDSPYATDAQQRLDALKTGA